MKKSSAVKKFISMLLIALMIAAMAFGVKFMINKYNQLSYPLKYTETVEKYCSEYDLDKNFVFAVIYCESRFKPNAESRVGARGLMQITSDTFDWIKYKLKDDREITFDNMYDPELNIEYGTFLLNYLFSKFEYPQNVLCAYNAGMSVAEKWLNDPEISENGIIVSPPYRETANYMTNVLSVAEKYQKIYFN